ncbi:hypothetical protein SAMN05192558_105182 [Actinokineospora alba]|uniref:LigA protein n=1 Tax=Actinokineospora alba TaxID=504798 RepID=A0A1H0N4B5_9PSEU|nr:hypothetical protein [Actinokineospora alba]TDP68555.1 hypothetical protein C8E96_4120 [Actinokineospora alba]SDH81596.1 hypothetical protein SAMN05421871_102232 [Actinokineospora alba]SDO87356.1 hypothetical protein SAMN05192558_105182 [Actinokineospora alba]
MTTTRQLVGLGAVAATFPYLALKLNWIFGGTVGVVGADMDELLVANIATVFMDLIVLVTALALTRPWGLRLPAPVVIVPMWLASGMLAPIVLLAPLLPTLLGDAPAGDAAFLRSWVYAVVYGGFALQGVLLMAAFVLYTRARWPQVWAARNTGAGDPLALGLAVVASVLALGVAAAYLSWAVGSTLGMPPGLTSAPGAGDSVSIGIHGLAALLTAAGLTWLVRRLPRDRPVMVPLGMTWVGAGAMFGWACWSLVTLGTRFGADDVSQVVVYVLVLAAQVTAAVLAAVIAAYRVTGLARQADLGGDAAVAEPTIDGEHGRVSGVHRG